MSYDPAFADILCRLANGEIEPDAWIEWWNRNSDWVAGVINRGHWLRLRPPQPGGFGPPCRCAFVSQAEACKLLDKWGVEYSRSDRYEQEWETHFKECCAQQEAQQKQRQRELHPILKLLAADFPRFVRFLRRSPEIVESMEPGASDEEIAKCESSLSAALPIPYKRFLNCCRSLKLGDTLKIGLPHMFVHEPPDGVELPTDGLLCFGECWLEADGDQVLFETSCIDPPVLYYAHNVPELRQVAGNFVEWVEGIPKWDCWK